jgi:acetoacetate decarboxylase
MIDFKRRSFAAAATQQPVFSPHHLLLYVAHTCGSSRCCFMVRHSLHVAQRMRCIKAHLLDLLLLLLLLTAVTGCCRRA